MALERILNRYEVVSRLGAGGMGDVWLARDEMLGRDVALKFVGERELRETPGAAEILKDEARHAGSLLGNPQILSVLDLIDVDTDLHKGPAVVLEYVDGCNVAEWITTYRPDFDEFTRDQLGIYIGREIVDAIHSAHKLNIMHRDIKPQNVLCSKQGNIKVADFGLSRLVEAITRTHTVWGRHTPLYSAPEQWQDEKPTEETDVYQLCATLYHLLTGEPANLGASLFGLMKWHESGTAKRVTEIAPAIPGNVADVIAAGLSKEPSERPSLWGISDELSRAIVTQPVRLVVDVTGLDEKSIDVIADLTDFSDETLKTKLVHGVKFPHPLEAMREAIGVRLLGGKCSLELVKDS